MNPALLKTLLVIFSSKDILKYIIWLFIFILALPIIAIFIISNAGIQTVSDKLVSINGKTQAIDIHDPTGKIIAHMQTATVWPVQGVVTLEFGQSDLPYQPIHTGIDIADKTGDPITPFMKGTVIDVEHLSWGYGNYVVVDHGNNITSLYGHMSQTNATKGEPVQPGDVIGYEGQTGWATGPHVHFQINVFGIPVNPRLFVEDNP